MIQVQTICGYLKLCQNGLQNSTNIAAKNRGYTTHAGQNKVLNKELMIDI